MFINLPNKSINLSKVSNIRVLVGHKIFFNMSYSIKIEKNNRTLWISDYSEIPWSEELELELKMNQYIQDNFITDSGHFINLGCISSIKKEPEKLKICINFSNPVTFGTGSNITSEFYFMNFKSQEELDSKYSMILSKLKGL